MERTTGRALHSIFSSHLVVPGSRLKGFADHAFSIAAPRLRNAAQQSINDCKASGAFKQIFRDTSLHLLLIRRNLFACIFVT